MNALKYLSLSDSTLLCIAAFTPVSAQTEQPPLIRNDSMIPTRDGVRLNTRIYAPANTNEQFSVLLQRTPYGIGNVE